MIIIFKVSTQLKTRAKNVNENLRTVLYLCGGFLAVVSQTSALVYFWSGKNLPLTWRRHFGGFSAVLKFLVASLGSLWFPWQDLTSCRCNLLTVFSFLTYHYNRPLGNIVLFVVMLMRKEKKNGFPAKATVCVEFSVLPAWAFSGPPASSHIPKMCPGHELVRPHCPCLSECGGVCTWPWDGRTSCSESLPILCLSCQDRLQPPATLNWKTCFYAFSWNLCIAHIGLNVGY